jgi:stage II sporulation protein P
MRKSRRYKVSSNNSSLSLRKRVVLVMATVFIAVCLTVYIVNSSNEIKSAASSVAEFSAKLNAPQGGALLLYENISKPNSSSDNNSTLQVFAQQEVLSSENDMENRDEQTLMPDSSSNTQSSSQLLNSSSVLTSKPPVSSAPSNVLKTVKTLQMGPTKSNVYVNYQNIWVFNQTVSHTADIAKQIAIRPDVHTFEKKGPQVLIVHTHTTEAYSSTDNGLYNPKVSTRNIDKSQSVCRVGDEISKELEANGIGVVNDTTYHDYPEFTDAYSRSLKTIQNNMKKYPSIQVVLDIHRDSIAYSDSTRVKPTAVINGKKAAQLMIVTPCNEATSLPIPDWQYNFRFGLRIQQQIQKDFPGLARPLNLCPRRYNMQACHGSLLIEIGTESNTLDEAVYAGHLFGDALSKVLLALKN